MCFSTLLCNRSRVLFPSPLITQGPSVDAAPCGRRGVGAFMRGVEERDGWLKLSEEEMSKDSNYARMQVEGGERDQRERPTLPCSSSHTVCICVEETLL